MTDQDAASVSNNLARSTSGSFSVASSCENKQILRNPGTESLRHSLQW
jgi:hypothetical protein